MIDCGTYQDGLTITSCIERQERRRRLRLAGDDLGAPFDLLIVHDPERVVRDIDHYVGLAEIARQPAPAFPVGDDALDLLMGRHRLRAVDGGDRLVVDDAVGLMSARACTFLIAL